MQSEDRDHDTMGELRVDMPQHRDGFRDKLYRVANRCFICEQRECIFNNFPRYNNVVWYGQRPF